MPDRAIKFALALGTTMLVAANLSFAKSHQIDVIYPTKVGTMAQLNPGTYRVHLIQSANSSKLIFYTKDDARVAQVSVKIKPETRKNPYTEVDYNTVAQNEHVITAIRLGGWNEEFVVPSSRGAMASRPTTRVTPGQRKPGA